MKRVQKTEATSVVLIFVSHFIQLPQLIVVGGTGCFEGISGIVEEGTDGGEFTYQITVFDEPAACPNGILDNPWVETYDGVYIDWDANDESAGDVYAFDSNELVTAGGVTGFVEGECMFLEDISLDKLFCTVTYGFDETDDRLLVTGLFDQMVITGGTGCFNGASGTVSGFDPDTGDLEYTVSLDDPDSASASSCIQDIFTNPWTEEYGDTFVDYNGVDVDTDGETAGDIYVFDNKVVTIPLPGGGTEEGTLAGRCFVTVSQDDLFCQYVVYAPGGAITFQGLFFDAMYISGASGCYNGLTGYVVGDADDNTETFSYTFVV